MTNEQREKLKKEMIELFEMMDNEKISEIAEEEITEDVYRVEISDTSEYSNWILLPHYRRYSKKFRTLGIISGWLNVLDIRDMKIKTFHKKKLLEEHDWEDRFEAFSEEIAG